MTKKSSTLLPATHRPPLTFGRLLVAYALIMTVPYIYAASQQLAYRGVYETVIAFLNIFGLAALLAQYPLSGRINAVTRYTGVDNGMLLHRKSGEYIALFFFLHPFLILAPRFFIAPQKAVGDIWIVFTSGEASTGVYAWALMGVWVLAAMYKDKLRLGYETWRLSHGLGFVAVAILATHHAVTVGRHGRYDPWFDVLWIALCTIAVLVVGYTYFVRPFVQKKRPFKVVEAKKAGASDWSLTIEKDGDFPFNFDAGQFLWINTSGNPFDRTEHPFSIASSPAALPRISFIIRELGDYTSQLERLTPGRRVYVDGPHGVFTLTGRQSSGIALIAGGAGIGPILGILRQLRDTGETRPIRLIYGNRFYEQMVFQDEIKALSDTLADFRQELVLEKPSEDVDCHVGFIDRTLLDSAFPPEQRDTWIFYVCGPPVMVQAVSRHLRNLGVRDDRIMFERLAF